VTPTDAAAAAALHDTAALYASGLGTAWNIVETACDALVAGLDSPSLGMLAALSAREADVEVPELLPVVLGELGLAPIVRDSDAAREAAVSALAARLVAGLITPRELASAAHLAFGHRLALTERLAELDDEYDILEYSGRTTDDVDADVIAEARRLASAHWRAPVSSADSSNAGSDRVEL